MTKRHCENCTCEEQPEERQFGNLLCRPIEQFGVAFKDIKIPKGWDIPTMAEGIELDNNKEFVEWSKFDDTEHDFYVKQPFKENEGKYAALIGCFVNHFNCYCNCDLDDYGSSCGILLIKRAN